jgi:predicted nuclease of predicted toxin-antitoxin system
MSVALYFDHNANPAAANELRRRGVDVIISREDGTNELRDDLLLERTTNLARVLYTEDQDFLAIAAQWERAGRFHAGVVYCRQRRLSIGKLIDDLELIAKAYEPEEVANRVIYLPL